MRYYRQTVCCALVAVAMTGLQATVRAAEKPDPSGTWKWERTFGGNTRVRVLKLQLKDGKLTGTYKGREDEIPIEGKIDGDKVSFGYTREFNGNKFSIRYTGKLVEDTIKGTGSFDGGERSREFEWEAKRSVELSDVLGTWKLAFEGRDGQSFESTLKISKDGDKVKGTYTSRFGEREIEDLKVADNQLTFKTTFERDGQKFTINYKLKPRGDSITGSLEFPREGENRSIEFKGKREAEKPAKKKKEEANS